MSILHEALKKAEKERGKTAGWSQPRTKEKSQATSIFELEKEQARALKELRRPGARFVPSIINVCVVLLLIVTAAVSWFGLESLETAQRESTLAQRSAIELRSELALALAEQTAFLRSPLFAPARDVAVIPVREEQFVLSDPIGIEEVQDEIIAQVTTPVARARSSAPIPPIPAELPAPSDLPSLTLNGIASDGAGLYFCVIENVVLREGQSVKGARVLSIKNEVVTLDFAGYEFQLNLLN